ncbi:hypothetical protein pipiens_001133 [Culex pipiens pipiens]|uniref:Uncharacterized protein n=1 Tax=Culex pipiens pipiens TaxID=38569 RepID=A0ABD1DVA0_CULPP
MIEDSQRNFGAILLLILVIALAIYTACFKLVLWIVNGLAVFTGLFLLFLWIVNGVIGYIEHGAVLSDTEPRLTDEDDQQMKVKYEAVLTRF